MERAAASRAAAEREGEEEEEAASAAAERAPNHTCKGRSCGGLLLPLLRFRARVEGSAESWLPLPLPLRLPLPLSLLLSGTSGGPSGRRR